MTRLTNDIRDSICGKLLAHRFDPEVAELDKEFATFAVSVWEACYSNKDRKAMNALPKGWLDERTSLKVEFGATVTVLHFGGVFRTDGTAQRFLAKHYSYGVIKSFAANHKLSIAYGHLEAKRIDLNTRQSEAERSAQASLAAISTVKKLIEVWPEIGPFASACLGTPVQVPAVQTATLNKIFDLPVDKAA